jgi:RNA-directed DNA polymerase
MEKQMIAENASAPITFASWSTINWEAVEASVNQLQMRIAKAIRESRYNRAKALQWLLTHSYYAKLLAIRRVSQNRGCKTPGVDKILWRTQNQKLHAVTLLRRKGYRPLPLKRIYIPKKSDITKLRPLSIPTMRDRAMQALYLLTLEPVAETLADKNSYGFRPKRSCADASEQCFKSLAKKASSKWILEGDIRACFDKISHPWLLNNIPMDKVILNKWLQSGYIDKHQLHATMEGVCQGGPISPMLLTITLSGLEAALKAATKEHDKVHLISYADDFVITGATKDILEQTVKPLVTNFIKERGLELSEKKTFITHIDKGFDFLGFNIRKYNDKLLIKPSKQNVNTFLESIRTLVKSKLSMPTDYLIRILNSKIRGWANYHRHIAAKSTFGKVDKEIFKTIWRWAKRRHPKKNARWVRNKYFCTTGNDHWVFNAGLKQQQNGRYVVLRLLKASSISIQRHTKIRAEANPYKPEYIEYFKERELSKRKYKVIKEMAGSVKLAS